MKAIFNHGEDSGISYFRMWMPSKYLSKTGWDVHKFDDLPQVISMTDWEELCPTSDILITQRSDNPNHLALMMAIRDEYDIPIVFEIDDDVFDISENSPAYQWFHPGAPLVELTQMVMRNADAMTVSTEELKKVYSKYNDNIYVLPNAQDPDDWKRLPEPRSRDNKDEIIVGWAGSATHYDDLRVIEKPVKRILRKYPNVKFRMLGCMVDFFDGYPQVEMRTDWAPIRQWQKKLATLDFDIAVAPLLDRPFNRGKSDIKWQEYAMLGWPTVASRVGPYKAIRDGVDGLTANSAEGWFLAIERLIKDTELRKSLGQEAKRKVLADHNIKLNIGQWDAAYRDIITRFKSKPHKNDIAPGTFDGPTYAESESRQVSTRTPAN